MNSHFEAVGVVVDTVRHYDGGILNYDVSEKEGLVRIKLDSLRGAYMFVISETPDHEVVVPEDDYTNRINEELEDTGWHLLEYERQVK